MQRLGKMVVKRVRSGQAHEIALGGHQVYSTVCNDRNPARYYAVVTPNIIQGDELGGSECYMSMKSQKSAASHVLQVMEEQPAAFNEMLLGFLKEHSPAS